MVNMNLTKRILCSPYEEIADLDETLGRYKSHALNIMGEKDDLSCSYFEKSNQTNRLGHSITEKKDEMEIYGLDDDPLSTL